MTRRCLQGIVSLLGCGFSIVVADNDSTDGTPQNVVKEFPGVQVLSLGENLGFGTANNRAVTSSPSADPIILLNNDTEPSPNAIQELLKSFEEAQKLNLGPCVLTPDIRNSDGTPQCNHYTAPTWGHILFSGLVPPRLAATWLHGSPKELSENGYWQSDRTSAVCWVMERNLWEQVGGFDEHIFMYNEDVDFAWRAHQLGARFLMDPRIPLIHIGQGSRISTYLQALQNDISQQYVFQKRWGWRGWLASKAYQLSRSVVRCILLAGPSLFVHQLRPLVAIHAKLLKSCCFQPFSQS